MPLQFHWTPIKEKYVISRNLYLVNSYSLCMSENFSNDRLTGYRILGCPFSRYMLMTLSHYLLVVVMELMRSLPLVWLPFLCGISCLSHILKHSLYLWYNKVQIYFYFSARECPFLAWGFMPSSVLCHYLFGVISSIFSVLFF